MIAGLHAAVMANFLNDPTQDGRYGYKVLLPTGRINGLNISIAEASGTVPGITIPRDVCPHSTRRTVSRATADGSVLAHACEMSARRTGRAALLRLRSAHAEHHDDAPSALPPVHAVSEALAGPAPRNICDLSAYARAAPRTSAGPPGASAGAGPPGSAARTW